MLDILHFLLNSTSFFFKKNPFWLPQNLVFLALLGVLVAVGIRLLASGSLLFFILVVFLTLRTAISATVLLGFTIAVALRIKKTLPQNSGLFVSLFLLLCVAAQGFYATHGQRWMTHTVSGDEGGPGMPDGTILLIDFPSPRERGRMVTDFRRNGSAELSIGTLALFETDGVISMRKATPSDFLDTKLKTLNGIPTRTVFPAFSPSITQSRFPVFEGVERVS